MPGKGEEGRENVAGASSCPTNSQPQPLPGPWKIGFALDFHSHVEAEEPVHTALGDRLARFKYGSHREEADPIARRLLDFLQATPHYQGVDLILHVPSEGRLRGWEPARELATRLGRRLRVKCFPGLIAKSRPSRPQKELLSREEKRANVAGAFRLRRPEFVRNKCVLVLDDLYDSGETLEEIYRLLKQAGAKEVSVLTVTRTSHSHT
jgi:predicted amidophosphoribosyltransferase